MRYLLIIIHLILFTLTSSKVYTQQNLLIFCGAAYKKPMDEIKTIFETKNGIKVNISYGSVKTISSQLLFSKEGDVLIVPSPDIMLNMVEKNIILKESIRDFSYQIPVILVQKGNPKKITGIKDLLKEDLKISIANPESVYIGQLAAEIIDKNFSESERNFLKKNIVTYADDISRLLAYLIMNQVDLIIGFDFLHGWESDKTELIKLEAKELERIGVGKAGVITYTKNQALAQKFVDFLQTNEANEILKKYGYITTKEEAFQFIGKEIQIGGIPKLKNDWIKK